MSKQKRSMVDPGLLDENQHKKVRMEPVGSVEFKHPIRNEKSATPDPKRSAKSKKRTAFIADELLMGIAPPSLTDPSPKRSPDVDYLFHQKPVDLVSESPPESNGASFILPKAFSHDDDTWLSHTPFKKHGTEPGGACDRDELTQKVRSPTEERKTPSIHSAHGYEFPYRSQQRPLHAHNGYQDEAVKSAYSTRSDRGESVRKVSVYDDEPASSSHEELYINPDSVAGPVPCTEFPFVQNESYRTMYGDHKSRDEAVPQKAHRAEQLSRFQQWDQPRFSLPSAPSLQHSFQGALSTQRSSPPPSPHKLHSKLLPPSPESPPRNLNTTVPERTSLRQDTPARLPRLPVWLVLSVGLVFAGVGMMSFAPSTTHTDFPSKEIELPEVEPKSDARTIPFRITSSITDMLTGFVRVLWLNIHESLLGPAYLFFLAQVQNLLLVVCVLLFVLICRWRWKRWRHGKLQAQQVADQIFTMLSAQRNHIAIQHLQTRYAKEDVSKRVWADVVHLVESDSRVKRMQKRKGDMPITRACWIWESDFDYVPKFGSKTPD